MIAIKIGKHDHQTNMPTKSGREVFSGLNKIRTFLLYSYRQNWFVTVLFGFILNDFIVRYHVKMSEYYLFQCVMYMDFIYRCAFMTTPLMTF